MPPDHLAEPSFAQRRLVEHGVGGDDSARAAPRLVVEAEVGKRNALAHKVVNPIVNDVDPRRILLMPFSRQAVAGMSRPIQRTCAKVLRVQAGIMTGALT